MIKFIKQLLCNHEYEFVRNIYGDEINHLGGKRSEYRCKKCGKITYKYTYKNSLYDDLHKIIIQRKETKYNNWLIENQVNLNNVEKWLKKTAETGETSYELIWVCDKKKNDKEFLHKWLKDNNLHCKTELYKGDEYYEVNTYIFKIYW